MKYYLLILFFSYSIILFSQEPICVKGYVIDDYDVLSDVNISIKGENNSVISKKNGRFKICCQLNDTLIFHSKSNFVKEEYIAKSDSLIIIHLIRKLEYKNGRQQISGRVNTIKYYHSFHFANTFYDKYSINVGYTKYFSPYFTENKNIPIESIGIGIDVSSCGQEKTLFPNVHLDIKNYHHLHNSYLNFFIPQLKLGYVYNSDSQYNKDGFGYSLEMSLFETNIRSANISLNLKYNNYTLTNNTFLLGISIRTYSKNHKRINIID